MSAILECAFVNSVITNECRFVCEPARCEEKRTGKEEERQCAPLGITGKKIFGSRTLGWTSVGRGKSGYGNTPFVSYLHIHLISTPTPHPLAPKLV